MSYHGVSTVYIPTISSIGLGASPQCVNDTHAHTKTRAQQLLRWVTVVHVHDRHAPKSEAAVTLSVGELGPHLTQCSLGRGLPPYQVAPWSIQLFGHNNQCYRQTDRTTVS